MSANYAPIVAKLLITKRKLTGCRATIRFGKKSSKFHCVSYEAFSIEVSFTIFILSAFDIQDSNMTHMRSAAVFIALLGVALSMTSPAPAAAETIEVVLD